jgi:hypothetical protein
MTNADYEALFDSYGGHFTVPEFHGNVDRMDSCFLRSFLAFRKWHGLATMVSSAYRPGKTSAHGHGLAVDCLLFSRWLQTQPSALNCWLLANTWGFKGIGLYFDWAYTNREGERVPAIGLHLDDWQGLRPNQRPLRWLRIEGHFYYQSTLTGLFFSRTANKSITLENAIKQHEQRKVA